MVICKQECCSGTKRELLFHRSPYFLCRNVFMRLFYQYFSRFLGHWNVTELIYPEEFFTYLYSSWLFQFLAPQQPFQRSILFQELFYPAKFVMHTDAIYLNLMCTHNSKIHQHLTKLTN